MINLLNYVLIALLWVTVISSCKRMNTPASDSESQTNSTVSKGKGASGRVQPNIPVPEPISPGTANVIIRIESIMADPGSQETTLNEEPRRAKAKVETVLGYGSGFEPALGDGQVIQVYFPAGMKLNGKEVQAQQKLQAKLQSPKLGSSWFTISSFTSVQ